MSYNTTDGLCECGCGQPTAPIQRPRRSRGERHGDRRRFVAEHAGRRSIHEKREAAAAVGDDPRPDVRRLPLTNGCFTLVDADEFDRLMQFSWRRDRDGYARSAMVTEPGQPARGVLLHRFIMGAKRGQIMDHINRDRLDNRRSNLRFVTVQQNMHNRGASRGKSKYRGVAWSAAERKWVATIYADGENRHLGWYRWEEEAARVYDEAAREHYGEYAYQNNPPPEVGRHAPAPMEIVRETQRLSKPSGKYPQGRMFDYVVMRCPTCGAEREFLASFNRGRTLECDGKP